MLWKDSFACDIPHIDAQHRALFDFVDSLGPKHGDTSTIPETLTFLAKYTSEHFADEESLFQQTNYPRRLEHQQQHSALIAKVAKFKLEYDNTTNKQVTLYEINHALVEWLCFHILSSDRDFGIFYHELPEETRKSLSLPHRPWIPESSQSFYQKAAGAPPEDDTA